MKLAIILTQYIHNYILFYIPGIIVPLNITPSEALVDVINDGFLQPNVAAADCCMPFNFSTTADYMLVMDISGTQPSPDTACKLV